MNLRASCVKLPQMQVSVDQLDKARADISNSSHKFTIGLIPNYPVLPVECGNLSGLFLEAIGLRVRPIRCGVVFPSDDVLLLNENSCEGMQMID